MLTVFLLYLLSLIIFFGPLIYWIKHQKKVKEILVYSIFYAYFTVLLWVVFFPIPFQWLWWFEQNNNFIPFYTLFTILSDWYLWYFLKIKQILWNILIIIPFWFFLWYIFKIQKFANIFLFSLYFSVWIEVMQHIIWWLIWWNYRSMDIDDIILNTFGGVFGYLIYKIFTYSIEAKKEMNT